MTKQEDRLTEEMFRSAFKFDRSFPERHYYPIHSAMWDSLLKQGFTEKRLTDWGFLKTDYLGASNGN